MALQTKHLALLTRLAAKGDVYALGILEGIKGEVGLGGAGARYEKILKNAAATSTTSCVTAKAGNLADNNLAIALATPDFPRNVTATFAASYDGGDITVAGTDHTGLAATETLTANPAGTTAGTIAWRTISSVRKGAVGATANTVSLGYTNLFGMGVKPLKELSVLCYANGVAETCTVDLTKGTVSPNTAPNATNDYIISAQKA